MTDRKINTEEKSGSPTTVTEDKSPTIRSNSSDNDPDVPATPATDEENSPTLSSANPNNNIAIEVEVKQGKTTTKPKEKAKKSKKKKSVNNNPVPPSNSDVPVLEQPPVPVYCRKCLGRNIGKKGERSDAYVITCSKCDAHEVLMKPDGNGVVKVSDPGAEALPQGDLLDAAWKSAEEKVFSALKLKEEDHPKHRNEQINDRITTFAQLLQNCSRECANLYPLIINLRSLQLKKTSSTPQKRNSLENEVKDRINTLEEGIREIESYEAKYFKKSPAVPLSSGAGAAATATEVKDASLRANPSLFDPICSAASTPAAASSTTRSGENKTGPSTGAAAVNVSNTAIPTPPKNKSAPWYIQKTEELNSRLEIMHCHLTKYTMMQSLLIQNRMKEDISKIKKNETDAIQSLQNFTQGLVDQCQNTTKSCNQKAEKKMEYIKQKQQLLAEARSLAEKCIAEGDEEGLRRIEEMLRENNLVN